MMTAIMQTMYAESYDVSVMRPGRSVRFDKMLFDYALKRPDLEPRDQLNSYDNVAAEWLPSKVAVFSREGERKDEAIDGEADDWWCLAFPELTHNPHVPFTKAGSPCKDYQEQAKLGFGCGTCLPRVSPLDEDWGVRYFRESTPDDEWARILNQSDWNLLDKVCDNLHIPGTIMTYLNDDILAPWYSMFLLERPMRFPEDDPNWECMTAPQIHERYSETIAKPALDNTCYSMCLKVIGSEVRSRRSNSRLSEATAADLPSALVLVAAAPYQPDARRRVLPLPAARLR